MSGSLASSTLSWLCALVAWFALSGCADPDNLDSILSEYQSRLARVLDTSLPELAEPEGLTYPDTDQLRYVIPALNINLTEWYGLRECELGTLVAQRNTALGKTATLSQRMIYESRLLEALASCQNQQPADSELASQLKLWRERKQLQYPLLWANLLQTSSEMRLAWSLSPEYVSGGRNRDAAASVQALAFLAQLKGAPELAPVELEQRLHLLDSSRLPAKLWRTQARLTQVLSELNSALEAKFDTLPCPSGRASEQVKILRNVFYLFFVQKIQPIGGQLNHYTYQLQPVWQEWLADDTLKPAFQAYLQKQGIEGFGEYRIALQTHVELWQGLLKRCNLSPTAPLAS